MKSNKAKNYDYEAFIDFMTRMYLKYNSTVEPHVKKCVSGTGSKRMTLQEYNEKYYKKNYKKYWSDIPIYISKKK